MSTPDLAIHFPDEARPEVSAFHAVNELQMAAGVEDVWAWLSRPELWPSFYGNSRWVRHLDGPWPEVALGTRFRWFTFGVMVRSEIVEYELHRRLAWSADELGAKGHHAWAFESRGGGCFVRTEETQRGWGARLIAPVMRGMMVRQHQRWLEGLAEAAAGGPPPASAPSPPPPAL